MEEIYHDVNLSMLLLKSVGLLLLFTGIGYFFWFRPKFVPQWKNILKLGGLLGLINAGLVISLGKIAFIVTPIVLIMCVILYQLNKLPGYKINHLLGLSVSFIFSSVIFFLGIAGTFFHLAVEGKI
jgi:hypothetical protein